MRYPGAIYARSPIIAMLRSIFRVHIVVFGVLILTLGNRERLKSLLTKYGYRGTLTVETSGGMEASKSALLRATESSRISLETITTAVNTETKPTPSKNIKNVTTTPMKFVGIWDKLNTTGLPMPNVEQGKCADVLCSEFVAESNLICAKMVKVQPAQRIIPRCRFQNGSLKPVVVLLSFPGSGNTWTRQLLEMSTGICTGMYNHLPWNSTIQCMVVGLICCGCLLK